jgi:hypothetical protein
MKPFEYEHLPHYLSLGAGVQSSTLALMYATGELSPMPAGAIFADTQAEPASVYSYLNWLESVVPFPVYRVSEGNLTKASLTQKETKDGRKYSKVNLPFWTKNPDGTLGKIPHRSCTADYKIKPIHKKLKELAGVKRGEKKVVCVSIIGISLDEMQRMKPSREKWNVHRWPLIEKRIRRQQCIEWMIAKGYPKPPRSACVYCPYHDAKSWRKLQLDEPKEFARAVQFEKDIQAVKEKSDNIKAQVFLHRSCKPLDQIDFRSDVERGQLTMWDDECEGMCGV